MPQSSLGTGKFQTPLMKHPLNQDLHLGVVCFGPEMKSLPWQRSLPVTMLMGSLVLGCLLVAGCTLLPLLVSISDLYL